MARKSRKNIMPQSAAPEIRISEEVNLLRTAAYARLSSENSGHETEDTLNTQILQIHNYIKEHPELTLTDTYVDNGFTGTNFDRPEFERMMQDVRTGKIQCIVVKDLSRFGRDCDGRAEIGIAHFNSAAGFLIHPVQIGFCVRDFGTDFKNVCTDGIC